VRGHQPHGVVPFAERKTDRKGPLPCLRRNMEKPEYYISEKVRGEVMRHFGYFMTESTGHLSEYVPWFRSSERALKLYCDEPGFGGESGAYYKYCAMLDQKYKNVNYLMAKAGNWRAGALNTVLTFWRHTKPIAIPFERKRAQCRIYLKTCRKVVVWRFRYS